MGGACTSKANPSYKCNRGSLCDDGADISEGATEVKAHHGQARGERSALPVILRELTRVLRL